MNIFFLHLIPQICARMHGDKHVVKMILESAQMLSTVYRSLMGEVKKQKGVIPCEGDTGWICKAEKECGLKPYKITHQKHGSTLWVAQCQGNFLWLAHLAYWLCAEKELRWPDNPPHKTKPLIEWFLFNPPSSGLFPQSYTNCFTVPYLAMPEEQKVTGGEDPFYDSIESYKNLYRCKECIGVVEYKRIPSRRPEWL